MILVEEGLTRLRDFSNRLFTVATGALALSIAFKGTITKSAPHVSWVLSAAWILLTISILTQLWWQFTEGLYFLTKAIGDETEKAKNGCREMKWSLVVSVVSFAMGIAAMCAFAVINNFQ